MDGVHWMLTDAIGSVEMVVDNRGSVEQHTGYYPYGEPWRNPAGQPYLFGAKERRSYASLNDYDFHARFYTAANTLWHAPDSHAGNRPWMSPFTFCSANPIRRIDPSGKDDKVLDQILGHQKLINLFDNDEEYKRSPERNIQPKQEQPQPAAETKTEEENSEYSALDAVVIGAGALSTSLDVQGQLMESACEKATGLEGEKAVEKFIGKDGAKVTKTLKNIGRFSTGLTGLNNSIIGVEYYSNGGREKKVYLKLFADVAVPIGASRLGWWGLAGTVVYEGASFFTGGFGTDSIIENQKIKHEEHIH